MKHGDQFLPYVAVHVHVVRDPETIGAKMRGGDAVGSRSGFGRFQSGSASQVTGGEISGVFPVTTSGVIDPYAIAVAWPGRWRAYLRAAYRTHRDVARAFNVSERTAGTWWEGLTGCKAPHLVVALRSDPVRASEMLLE